MSVQQDHALANEIDAYVELICNLGCGRVYRIIELMERREDIVELNGATAETHQAVLRELKAIMAIYDARDGGAACKMPFPDFQK